MCPWPVAVQAFHNNSCHRSRCMPRSGEEQISRAPNTTCLQLKPGGGDIDVGLCNKVLHRIHHLLEHAALNEPCLNHGAVCAAAFEFKDQPRICGSNTIGCMHMHQAKMYVCCIACSAKCLAKKLSSKHKRRQCTCTVIHVAYLTPDIQRQIITATVMSHTHHRMRAFPLCK